jgi:hypothetical protein
MHQILNNLGFFPVANTKAHLLANIPCPLPLTTWGSVFVQQESIFPRAKSKHPRI